MGIGVLDGEHDALGFRALADRHSSDDLVSRPGLPRLRTLARVGQCWPYRAWLCLQSALAIPCSAIPLSGTNRGCPSVARVGPPFGSVRVARVELASPPGCTSPTRATPKAQTGAPTRATLNTGGTDGPDMGNTEHGTANTDCKRSPLRYGHRGPTRARASNRHNASFANRWAGCNVARI